MAIPETKTRRPIQALGEIALRVSNLDATQHFYENVVGLQLLRRFDNSAFFKIADGYAGHTVVLALFDRSARLDYRGVDAAKTTVDHLAFTIAREDYVTEKSRLESLGCTVTTAVHHWVQWRSLYVSDPDGNTVELVCHDPDIPLTE